MIKNGELALKGLNRHTFEEALMKNIRWRLKDLGKFTVTRAQSTMYIQSDDAFVDYDEVAERISKVFGIAAFTRAAFVEKDLNIIKQTTVDYMAEVLADAKTFKVNARRSDKKFPLSSPEIPPELGATLLCAYPQ